MTPAAAGRGRTKRAGTETKGERTKAQIKQSILRLVARKGLFELTLDDICRANQLTVGAFYFHFPGKDQAVEETIAEVVHALYSEIDSMPLDRSIEEDIRWIVATFVGNCTDRPEAVQAIYKVLPNSPLVYRTWLVKRAEFAHRLEDRFARVREASGRSAATMRMEVAFLLAAMEGLLENIFFGADRDLMEFKEDPGMVVEQLTALWYRTILGDDPSRGVRLAKKKP